MKWGKRYSKIMAQMGDNQSQTLTVKSPLLKHCHYIQRTPTNSN